MKKRELDQADKAIAKLRRILTNMKTDSCLFCKKKFTEDNHTMDLFCDDACELGYVFKFELM